MSHQKYRYILKQEIIAARRQELSDRNQDVAQKHLAKLLKIDQSRVSEKLKGNSGCTEIEVQILYEYLFIFASVPSALTVTKWTDLCVPKPRSSTASPADQELRHSSAEKDGGHAQVTDREERPMLELILTLLDQLIGLVNHRQETDRRVFDHFIDPAFKAFENVHKHYIESFKHYRQLINTPRKRFTETHPIFEQIRMDRLYNQDPLSKCWSLERHAEDVVIGKFVQAILHYLSAEWMPLNTSRITEHKTSDYDTLKTMVSRTIANNIQKNSSPDNDSIYDMIIIDEQSKLCLDNDQVNKKCVLVGDLRQVPASRFYAGLEHLVRVGTRMKEARTLVSQEVDSMISGFQVAYAQVADEYAALKYQPLRPM